MRVRLAPLACAALAALCALGAPDAHAQFDRAWKVYVVPRRR